MTAEIIDGKAIAKELREDLTKEVAEMVAAGKPKPGLATVLVGEDPASQSYVRSKQKASAKVGIESFGDRPFAAHNSCLLHPGLSLPP